ncbi:Jacalin-related lectin 38 [Raphanus sativus]|nr:Jacalin-related lectin 38 [Raphanus sativus]
MKFMNVSVPEWSSFKVVSFWYPPSYFIDDKSHSLVLCSYNEERKATIYIAKGDKFNEIKINDLVDDYPRHRTYFPSLVQVPTIKTSSRGPVGSLFTLPKGVEVSNGVGGNEWDDGVFDRIEKIYVGEINLGGVFLKCDYVKDNMNVVGVGHWSANTLIPDLYDIKLIANDDYIEAIEGSYTESQITSIMFRTHKKTSRPLQCGMFNGKPFVLRGEKGSKIIGFYGRSSGDHLTALGIHLSAPG